MSRRLLSLAVLAAVSSGAFAQKLAIEDYRLPNGMRVILQPDRTLPVAAINTWFGVGSKDEPDGRSGFAHLYEHLMFMGTFRVPQGEFDSRMEAVGGQNNASTRQDATNYYSSGPSATLPLLLYLDADRLEALGAATTQEKLDLQRQVVLNERRQSSENVPYGKAYEAIPGLVWPKGHPYSWSVIGSPEDLRAARLGDVKVFFSTYYVPRNATLVVAGDFDPKAIKPLIARWYGTLPAGAPVPRRAVPPVPPLGVKRVTMTDRVSVAKTIEVWRTAKAGTKEELALAVAATILADGPATRLYDRLVAKDKLATEVGVGQESLVLGSLTYLDATASEGASQDALERAADEELARFANDGPTREEVARAVAKTEAGLLKGLQAMDARADAINGFVFYRGTPNALPKILAELRSLTPKYVRETFRANVRPNERLILRVTPEPGDATAAPPVEPAAVPPAPTVAAVPPNDAANPRATIPTVGAARPFSPPTPTVFRLRNGIEVRYVPRPELPLMSFVLASQAGADADAAGKRGAAALMAAALSDGAGDLDAKSFRARLDLLGAQFSARAALQATTVALSAPARNFRAALSLAAKAIRDPRFDGSEVERERRLALDEIARRGDEPSILARLVAQRELFGADSPFGMPISGDAATVGGLTVPDLRASHSRVFGVGTSAPQPLAIFVAGSLPEAEVRAALEREFGAWERAQGSQPIPVPKVPTASKPTRLVIVDRPGAVQTVIEIVAPGAAYSDPERPVLEGVANVFGGSFTSRLNQKLREEKGYTYGAGQRFTFGRDLGTATISTSVRTDVTGASLGEILGEMKRIREGGVTSTEVAKAASILRQGVVEELGTVESVTAALADLWTRGASDDALARDLDAYAALDPARESLLARERITLEGAVIVLVGDRKAIEPQLAGLELPKPEIVTP